MFGGSGARLSLARERIVGGFFKKLATTATRVAPPTSASKSAQSGHFAAESRCPEGVASID